MRFLLGSVAVPALALLLAMPGGAQAEPAPPAAVAEVDGLSAVAVLRERRAAVLWLRAAKAYKLVEVGQRAGAYELLGVGSNKVILHHVGRDQIVILAVKPPVDRGAATAETGASQPLDPYGPSADPGGAPTAPGAAPAAPLAPNPEPAPAGASGAPLDPYGAAPAPTNPAAGAPLDPYANTPAPAAPAASAPIDPYRAAPAPAESVPLNPWGAAPAPAAEQPAPAAEAAAPAAEHPAPADDAPANAGRGFAAALAAVPDADGQPRAPAGAPAADPTVEAPMPAPAARPEPARAEGPAALGRTSVAFERRELSAALADFDKLAREVQVEAHPRGVAIAGLARGSFLDRIGLRTGDVIVSVAGQSIASVDAAAEVYSRILIASAFDIELERDGAAMTIDCQIR